MNKLVGELKANKIIGSKFNLFAFNVFINIFIIYILFIH